MNKLIIKRFNIKLETTTARYGSSGAKPSKVKSTASSKFKAISTRLIQKQKEDENQSSNNDNSESKKASKKVDKGPLPYGSHNGNIQIYTILDLKDQTFEDISKYFTYVDNITATLESRSSMDIRKKKHDYLVAKDQILKKYYEAYGSQPGDEVTANMLNELRQYSFEYSKTQIVISITTDEYIEGSKSGTDGLFHLELRTKALWRPGKTLLSPEEIKAIISVEEEKKVNVTTNRVTVERYIAFNPTTGHYKINWGKGRSSEPGWV